MKNSKFKNWLSYLKLRIRVLFGGSVGDVIPDKPKIEPKIAFREPRNVRFRCPSCGDGKKIIDKASGVHMEQNEDLSRLSLFLNGVQLPFPSSEWNDVAYVYRDFPRTKVTCGSCEKENEFWHFNNAYYNAYKYFDVDNSELCSCGGEMLLSTNGIVFNLVCEDCGHVNDKVVVSSKESLGEEVVK